jgi:hypothetical protein
VVQLPGWINDYVGAFSDKMDGVSAINSERRAHSMLSQAEIRAADGVRAFRFLDSMFQVPDDILRLSVLARYIAGFRLGNIFL